MPVKHKEVPTTAPETPEDTSRNALIGSHIMRALGRPNNLLRVEVRRLWVDRYRVNVFVGTGVVAMTIAHSYFLVVDGNGNILQSTPQVVRQY